MNRIIIFVVFINISIPIFSQAHDYANGNGTIIDSKIFENIQWTIRKHIQTVITGDLADESILTIFDKPSLNFNGRVIGHIKLNENIMIKQVAETEINGEYFSWLFVNVNNMAGWIFYGKYDLNSASYSSPYYNNRWEIVDRIKINNKIWTCRRMNNQLISIWTVLNIRDKPGVIDTNIISKIIPSQDNPQINVVIIEATEEKETIDNKTDLWLKIKYKNIVGWIFGGYASVERGGPKYNTPESLIDFELGWY
jgi:hypothetical protein